MFAGGFTRTFSSGWSSGHPRFERGRQSSSTTDESEGGRRTHSAVVNTFEGPLEKVLQGPLTPLYMFLSSESVKMPRTCGVPLNVAR